MSKFLHHVGGVETYVEWLANALQAAGHDVAVLGMRPPEGEHQMSFGQARVYETPRREYVRGSLHSRMRSALSSVYSRSVETIMEGALNGFMPDVVHYHGTCYQLTSAVVRVANGRKIRRIATAHDYKLMCANQRLWNDSAMGACTKCVGASRGGRLLNPIATSCIKGSMSASAIGGIEAVVSDSIWRNADDMTIHAPSKFMAHLLQEDGWSPRRVQVLDLPWLSMPSPLVERGANFLYMGRLAVEKDVATLLDGWSRVARRIDGRRMIVAGSGAEEHNLQSYVSRSSIPKVQFLGRIGRSQIHEILGAAAATVHPAAWFENSPFAVRESLMAGVPALVADTGGMPELIEHGVTGMRVDHTPEGWAQALLDFSQSGLVPGGRVVAAVNRYRTSEQDHLASLLQMYGQ